MSHIPVTQAKWNKLSDAARWTLAALEKQNHAGDAVWEINVHLTAHLAKLRVYQVYAALDRLADLRIIARRFTDECCINAVVAAHADRAQLDHHNPDSPTSGAGHSGPPPSSPEEAAA